MAASLCGPVSQLLRHMHSACCKYSVHRALSPHRCLCWAGVTPAPPQHRGKQVLYSLGMCSPHQNTAGFARLGPWGGEGLGPRLNKPIVMYCCTIPAALALDSKRKNGQRYCCCALRENDLLNIWSILTTWVKYLSLVTPLLSLGPPRHVSCSWFSV